MEMSEIRAAASSAACYIGNDRINFIKNSYPIEYWDEINRITAFIDDYSNDKYEESRITLNR